MLPLGFPADLDSPMYPARRTAPLCRAVVVACAALGSGCVSPSAAPENFLLITLDTLRADHLGAYGYPRETSPHLDAFAGKATLFQDVTCSMPTTLPSHLTIFTGLTPDRHGVMQNGATPAADLVSFFDLLRERGLRTAAVVAAGVLGKRFVSGLGFDEVLDAARPENGHQVPAGEVTDQAERWLEEHGDAPFALWLHYFDTHEPYTPPKSFAETFTGDYQGPIPDALGGSLLASFNSPKAAAELSPADRQHVVDLYDAEIAYLDSQLGRLFALLEERGLAATTLIVIVGDHGQAPGENNRYGHGEWLLEPIIKVPLIVRLPGQRRRRAVASPVETLDLLPTVAELFELTVPDPRPGRSLVAALHGGPLQAPPYRVVQRRHYGDAPQRRGIAVLLQDEKWVFYRNVRAERFFLGKRSGIGGLDGENFYSPDSAAATRFRELTDAFDRAGGSLPDMSAETRDMLRSLGYVD